MQRLDDWSRMNREIHVRFSESLRGQFPWATRLLRQFFPKGSRFEEISERALKRAKGLLNRRPRKHWVTQHLRKYFLGSHLERKLRFKVESASQ